MEYRVFTKKLAMHLTNLGFKFIRTAPDLWKPQFINWYFEDTPELRQAIMNYTKKN